MYKKKYYLLVSLSFLKLMVQGSEQNTFPFILPSQEFPKPLSPCALGEKEFTEELKLKKEPILDEEWVYSMDAEEVEIMDLFQKFVPPVKESDLNSGWKTFLEASKEEGTFVYEVFRNSKDVCWLNTLLELARISYNLETNAQPIMGTPEKTRLQNMQSILEKLDFMSITPKKLNALPYNIENSLNEESSQLEKEIVNLSKKLKEVTLNIQNLEGEERENAQCFQEQIKQELSTCSLRKAIEDFRAGRKSLLAELEDLEFISYDENEEKYKVSDSTMQDIFYPEKRRKAFEERLNGVLDLKIKGKVEIEGWLQDIRKEVTYFIDNSIYKNWHHNLRVYLKGRLHVKKYDFEIIGVLGRNKLKREEGKEEQQFSTYLVFSKSRKALFLVTAGTKSMSDWLQNNLQATLTTDKSKGAAETLHSMGIFAGFYKGAFEDISRLRDFLDDFIEMYPDVQFYSIGHSLGGAVATLQGMFLHEYLSQKYMGTSNYLQITDTLKNRIKILGIASPMPTMGPLAAGAIEKNIGLGNALYIDNYTDLVPSATFIFGYNKVGLHLVLPKDISEPLAKGQLIYYGHHILDSYIESLEGAYFCAQQIIEYGDRLCAKIISQYIDINKEGINNNVSEKDPEKEKRRILYEKLKSYHELQENPTTTSLKTLGAFSLGYNSVYGLSSKIGGVLYNFVESLFSSKSSNSEENNS